MLHVTFYIYIFTYQNVNFCIRHDAFYILRVWLKMEKLLAAAIEVGYPYFLVNTCRMKSGEEFSKLLRVAQNSSKLEDVSSYPTYFRGSNGNYVPMEVKNYRTVEL